jgi:hypothetical protein
MNGNADVRYGSTPAVNGYRDLRLLSGGDLKRLTQHMR